MIRNIVRGRLAGVLASVAALAAAGCGPRVEAPPTADPATRRTTSLGDVIGFTADNGAQVWRALPFATPPEGDLRWRAPRPPQPWQGEREALDYAPWCTQLTNRLDEGYGLEPGTVAGSEDCLYVNVYAPPAGATDEPAPVMVWIHGGSNVWGRAENYDGAALAARENVVVVILQYRLGPMGFLSHAALRDTAQTNEDRAANFALLDQMAALTWVRDNIAVFGGDPGRVTIFGESAGGHNVAGLLTAPGAKGLYHRAIMQSGMTMTVTREVAEADENEPGLDLNPSGVAVRALLGQDAGSLNSDALAAQLRALTQDEILAAYWGEGGTFIELPRMIEDGVTVPLGGIAPALAQVRTPLMTGTNRDESRFFNFLDDTLVGNKFGMIFGVKDADFYEPASDYQSLFWRVHAVDDVARAVAAGGSTPVYAYRFDWDEQGKIFFSNFSQLVGAGHGMEIPFVFEDWGFGGRLGEISFNDNNAVGREGLSQAMMSYWAAFARDGSPATGSRGDLPAWTTWEPTGVAVMMLDSADGGGVRMENGALTADGAIARLESDPRLSDIQDRCRIYGAAAGWFPMIAEAARPPEGCDRDDVIAANPEANEG